MSEDRRLTERRLLRIVVLLPLAQLGCSERVTNGDVERARHEAETQRREATDVKTQVPGDSAVVRKQESEARDAELKFKETELKAAAMQARDDFVRRAEELLAEVEHRIHDLRSTSADHDEAARSAANLKIADLEDRSRRAVAALGELQAADLLLWDQRRGETQRLLDELRAAVR